MEERLEARRGSIAALLLAIVIASIWSFVSLIQQKTVVTLTAAGDVAEAAGHICGSAVAIAFFCWIPVYIIFLRGRGAGRGAAYFATLVVVVIAIVGGAFAALISYAKHQAASNDTQLWVADREIKRMWAEVLRNPETGGIDTHIYATGDAGIIERDAKRFGAAELAEARTFRQVLVTSGYPGYLKPERLFARGGIAAARRNLALTRAALAAYHGRIRKFEDDFLAAVGNEKIDEQLKRGFLRGVRNREAQIVPLRDRLLDVQDKSLAEFQAMVEVLARTRGRWEFDGKHVLFADPRDRIAYNQHVEAARDSEQLHQALLDTVKQAQRPN
jgi:hypothetical protein